MITQFVYQVEVNMKSNGQREKFFESFKCTTSIMTTTIGVRLAKYKGTSSESMFILYAQINFLSKV